MKPSELIFIMMTCTLGGVGVGMYLASLVLIK